MELDGRKLLVVNPDRKKVSSPLLLQSLQEILREQGNSLKHAFSYKVPDQDKSQGILVICLKEIFGREMDVLKKILPDEVTITRAQKNLNMISLEGPPPLDSIPLYFESVTFCGIDDGEVIGYKVTEEKSIVLITTDNLDQLLKHRHKDSDKQSFEVKVFDRFASIESDLQREEELSASSSHQRNSNQSESDKEEEEEHVNQEESEDEKKPVRQTSSDDKKKFKRTSSDDKNADEENRRKGADSSDQEDSQYKQGIDQEDSQSLDQDHRIKRIISRKQGDDSSDQEDSQHKNESRDEEDMDTNSDYENDDKSTDVDKEYVIVHFSSHDMSSNGGGYGNRGRGGNHNFSKKDIIVEKVQVDTEERLELICFFITSHRIMVDNRQISKITKETKKRNLLVITGYKVAVNELVATLKASVFRDRFYKIDIGVKLDFGSQLVSVNGREWFEKFTQSENLYIVEGKIGKRFVIVTFDEEAGRKWADKLEKHLICAKIPYDDDIKFGDSKWKSKAKDWKKKWLITIGHDKPQCRVEIYGVPKDVIAALDDVDIFVSHKEKEKPGFIEQCWSKVR